MGGENILGKGDHEISGAPAPHRDNEGTQWVGTEWGRERESE